MPLNIFFLLKIKACLKMAKVKQQNYRVMG